MNNELDALIGRAAQELAEDWASLRQEAVSPEEARVQVGVVTEAIRRRLHGDPEFAASLTPTPLGRRITNLIRRRFLVLAEGHRREVRVADLFAVLAAIDEVAAGLEPSWDLQFADRLSGPEALELVVEVAHDLRSPLTSILFLAETLKRGRSGTVTPLQERQLGLIYSAAFGLSSVASDVIELVRGRERVLGSETMPFRIDEILEAVRDIVLPIAEEKNLEIRISAADAGTRIGQPVALSRVLLNLTTNALKFTDSGYVELSAVPGKGDRLEFAVRDTGRGIPPEALAMLFEPFRRRNRAGDYAFSGSGLGLSICRKLVEAMGGEVVVQTDQGKGTRFGFVVSLPAVAQSLPMTHMSS
jgi:signal transduction histidine kinase